MSIIPFPMANDTIDVKALRRAPQSRSASGLISPAKESVTVEIVPDHTAEPIKSMQDIIRVTTYLKEKGRFRDNMFFIVGISSFTDSPEIKSDCQYRLKVFKLISVSVQRMPEYQNSCTFFCVRL